ncbi:hypothetical protein GGF37_007234, partial [Kickxella alabastrina]
AAASAADKATSTDSENVSGLTAAIEAMCDDFDHNTSRQRTFSWVSSELPSPKGRPSEDHFHVQMGCNFSAGVSEVGSSSGRLRTRLATIDPIRASASAAVESYCESIDGRSSNESAAP